MIKLWNVSVIMENIATGIFLRQQVFAANLFTRQQQQICCLLPLISNPGPFSHLPVVWDIPHTYLGVITGCDNVLHVRGHQDCRDTVGGGCFAPQHHWHNNVGPNRHLVSSTQKSGSPVEVHVTNCETNLFKAFKSNLYSTLITFPRHDVNVRVI